MKRQRVAQIYSNGEYMTLFNDGCIQRGYQANNFGPSGDWKITGAVRVNNFGHITERYSLADILAGNIEWSHKNGSQRVHLTDLDHGTRRMWGSPKHHVIIRRDWMAQAA